MRLSRADQQIFRLALPPFVPGGTGRFARADPEAIEHRLVGWIAFEEVEQDVGELARGRKEQAVVGMPDPLCQAGAVVQRADRHTRPEQIGDLHRDVEPGGGAVKAQSDVGAADDEWIFVRLQPPRPQMDAPRRQSGEPPLELGAALAVSGHEDDELWKAAAARHGFPAADPLLEPQHGVGHDVKVFVLGPARWTHDEAGRSADDAHPPEQAEAESLTGRPVHRHEHRCRPVIEHVRVSHAEPALEKRDHATGDAQVRVDASRIPPLDPAGDAYCRMPSAQPALQQRVPEVVPVDHKTDSPGAEREPGDGQRGKRRRILHDDQVGPPQGAKAAPESEGQAQRVAGREPRVADRHAVSKP